MSRAIAGRLWQAITWLAPRIRSGGVACEEGDTNTSIARSNCGRSARTGQPGPIGGAGALQRRQATGARRAFTGDHEPQASVGRVRGRDQPQECIDQCRVVAGSVHGARAADHENAVAMAEQLHEAIAGASGAERIDDMDNQPRRPCAPIERSSGRSGRPCMADMTDGGRCHGLLHAVRHQAIILHCSVDFVAVRGRLTGLKKPSGTATGAVPGQRPCRFAAALKPGSTCSRMNAHSSRGFPMSTQHDATAADLAARIKHVRFPMFTWQDEHGHLLSQPMTVQQIDEEGAVWFYTSTLTPLWGCIAHRPLVNLAFTQPDDALFVSVSGVAERVVDRERIRAMWNAFVQAWFPAGPDDEHAVLIRVVPHTAEYWDSNDSKMVRMFAMAKAAITGQRPDMDSEHGTLKL
jgi:general stress protein 26